MKLTFQMVAATDINVFNSAVNDKLILGYKFITSQPVVIVPTTKGTGMLYSVPMLLEEQEQNGQEVQR